MNRTFTSEEFHKFAIKPNGLDKGFLKRYVNKRCINAITPLQWAAGNGHLDTVKYLVENGANVILNDNRAVRYAAECGHLETVKYLIDKGADITAYGNCAIRWAAGNGHLDVVKYLLNTFIYSEKDVRSYAVNWAMNEVIRELLINYQQFSNTKACK